MASISAMFSAIVLNALIGQLLANDCSSQGGSCYAQGGASKPQGCDGNSWYATGGYGQGCAQQSIAMMAPQAYVGFKAPAHTGGAQQYAPSAPQAQQAMPSVPPQQYSMPGAQQPMQTTTISATTGPMPECSLVSVADCGKNPLEAYQNSVKQQQQAPFQQQQPQAVEPAADSSCAQSYMAQGGFSPCAAKAAQQPIYAQAPEAQAYAQMKPMAPQYVMAPVDLSASITKAVASSTKAEAAAVCSANKLQAMSPPPYTAVINGYQEFPIAPNFQYKLVTPSSCDEKGENACSAGGASSPCSAGGSSPCSSGSSPCGAASGSACGPSPCSSCTMAYN